LPRRRFKSLGHALRFAAGTAGYVVDDNGITFMLHFMLHTVRMQLPSERWSLCFAGEVTDIDRPRRLWTTEELVSHYDAIKPGFLVGAPIEGGCPGCGADADQLWPLMFSTDGDALCQCVACGRWTAIERRAQLEAYVRSRPSGLASDLHERSVAAARI
jgi:hypothetical protein